MKPSGFERLVFPLVGILTLVFISIPTLVVAVASLDPSDFFTFPPQQISPKWFITFLEDEGWRSAAVLTLTIAVLTGLGSMAIGGAAGLAIGRMPDRWTRWTYPLLLAPVVFPVIILAISFYTVALELHLVGSLIAFVAANLLLTSPIVAVLVSAAVRTLDPRIELASLSCGAGPLRTLWQITIPLLLPTAAAGGVLAFLLTLDEVVMSLFLVAPARTPLAVKMFLQVGTGTAPIVMAASTVLILLAVAFVGAAGFLRAFAGYDPGPARHGR